MTSSAKKCEVSIIITCHNQLEWISEAVDSALAQGPDVEVIAIDDGSTDGSDKVLDNYGCRLRAVHTDNLGVAAARNCGIELATGSKLIFLDGDDRLAEGYVAAAAAALERSPQAGYAYPTIRMFGTQEHRAPAPPWDASRLAAENFVAISSLFRSEVIAAVRFDSELSGLEDWDFVLTLLDANVSGTPAPDAVLEYRRHVKGQSRGDRAARSILKTVLLHLRVQRRHTSVTQAILLESTLRRIISLGRSKAVAVCALFSLRARSAGANGSESDPQPYRSAIPGVERASSGDLS